MGHAIIAGAGPAGAALAYLLASRGVEVTLVERQRDFAREFRGELLMPSGLDAIRQMGLAEPFAKVPQVRPQAIELYLERALVTRVEVDPAAGIVGAMVSQPAFLEMIVGACGDCGSFRLLRGATVRDVLRDDGRIVGVRVEDGEGTHDLRSDLVIGADGRGSIVRRRAGMAEPDTAETFDVVWFKVAYPAFLTGSGRPVQGYFSRGHVIFLFPSHDGRLQVAWVIRKGTFGEMKRQSAEMWARELATYVSPELGAHLLEQSSALVHPFVLDVRCYLLPEWTAPGMMLLGDAAHPMSPVGGQGVNIALRDALVAANHLVPVLMGVAPPGDVDQATRSYHDERLPEVAEIQKLQRRPPQVVFREVWWSDLALRVVPRLLRFRLGQQLAWRQVGRKMALGVTEVTLTV